MMTLLILVSATWLGLYLAKRITRPVHMLAAGAKEIGAGHLDHRIEPETRDEFGSLVEAFNAMAGELATSQRRLERSRQDLEKKNSELDERRRYIETVLERIATGVVSLSPDGRVTTINAAALRLLDIDASVIGAPADQVFARDDLQPLAALVRAATAGPAKPAGQEIALTHGGREIHLATAATTLQSGGGTLEGAVLVFDDVTPLVRTQRVAAWRDVARRLAHEIKNPLTPIQLCAERIRRHFGTAPSPARELVEECTTTIVGEVESLKALVDEFAQFARMPAPRAVPANLNAVLDESLALYNGLFKDIHIDRQFAPALPPVRLDVEQIRRVVINLVDNAVEALGGAQAGARLDGEPARITIETVHDPANAVARLVVADNGPGVPAADRDKLFMPYYSTKRRGSGLGLAIVRRIVAEHGGSIEVGDNSPHGSRFVIELPC
jgi:PAS domain S-box-containing protein